jgi:hypothetical protein
VGFVGIAPFVAELQTRRFERREPFDERHLPRVEHEIF